MSFISISNFKTPVGDLILGEFQEQICLCDWRFRKMRNAIDKRIQQGLNSKYQESETPLIVNLKNQLSEYFENEREDFDIPILLIGTDFQKSVWQELVKIPFGETRSYLSLSQQVGNEKAIRAVASANGANAISILVPCHRIIGSNNELTGYAGGLNAKKNLLKLEGINLNSQLELF